MNLGEAIAHNIRNCLRFSGRDPRSSFWWYVLFVLLGSILANAIDAALFVLRAEEFLVLMDTPELAFQTFLGSPWAYFRLAPVTITWSIINIVPLFSCGMRRRHDCDRSGTFFAVVAFVGLLAGIAGLYYMFQLFDLFSGFIAVAVDDPDLRNFAADNPDMLVAITELTGITSILSLVQFAAGVIILIMMVTKGTEGENRFGPDPLTAHTSTGAFPT